MSLTYGFYNSRNGDRRYNADQMSRLFDGIITDGVYESIGDKLMVSASAGMTVNVGTGRAWFNHTWVYNDSLLPINISESNVVLNRIDTVVIDIDKLNRVNDIFVVEGIAASSPVPPTLINDPDSEHYQYPLCDIYVAAGVSEIKQEKITNRVGIDYPFVTGAVQSVSVDGLVAQWQAGFESWMNALRGILDEDAATKMAAEILELQSGKLSVDGTSKMVGNLDMDNKHIVNLPMPTENQQAANKQYVDDFCSQVKFERIWENASPESVFGSTTIWLAKDKCRLIDYDAFLIVCRPRAGEFYDTINSFGLTAIATRKDGLQSGCVCTLPAGKYGQVEINGEVTTNGYVVNGAWTRMFRIMSDPSTNAIYVDSCYGTSVSYIHDSTKEWIDLGNSFVIPYRIYGIKLTPKSPTAPANWLIENELLTSSANTTLPAPTIGSSYTCFVNGVEGETAVAYRDNNTGKAAISFYHMGANNVSYQIHYASGWYYLGGSSGDLISIRSND